MMPLSRISSLSSLTESHDSHSSRVSDILAYSINGRHVDEHAENTDNQTDQISRLLSEHSHDVAPQVQHSFDGYPDLELRSSTLSPTREHQSSSDHDEVTLTKQVHNYVSQDLASSEHIETEPIDRLMWTPVALHWASLAAFGLLFAIMLAALEALDFFSRKNNGLTQANPKNYYLWTYGPTAVLSIIGALWAQVEYRVKQLLPWQVLKQGPVEATRSVLLDYVSPWNVISLFKSIGAGHYVVTTTISATLLIKLMIVLSTGLLLLQDVSLQNIPAQFVTSDKFDDNGFDSSAVGSTPALTVAGIALLGLSFPLGTSSDHAYQSFNTSGTVLANGSSLFGNVGTFTADLECESADLQQDRQACMSTGCERWGRYLQLSTSTCRTQDFLAFVTGTGAPDVFFGSLAATQCQDYQPDGDSRRLVIATGRFTPNESLSFTGLICKPTYNITTKTVSLYASGSLRSIGAPSISTAGSIPQISSWDITSGINSSMLAASQQIVGWDRVYTSANMTWISFDTFFACLNMTAPQERATDFLNRTLLLELSRRTFRSLAVQVAKQYLMISANDRLAGSIDFSESRLLVRQLSLRAMQATLAVLIMMTGILIKFRPHHISTRDPGSVIGISTILSSSPSLMSILSRSGLVSMDDLKTVLAGRHYQSILTSGSGWSTFQIEEVSRSRVSHVEPQEGDKQKQDHWWRPFSVTILARILILLVPIALVLALEGTYQVSYRHDGIAEINPGTYIRYTWVYVPALIMLGIRALFDTVDFNTRVFQPYCALHHRSATAGQSMFVDYLAKTSMHTIYSGLARRQFAVVFTSATMFMAPFLTIVVSGLFATKNTPQTISVMVDRLDWFNASALSTYDPNTGNARSNLVGSLAMETELDYPQWTSEDLVFPQISLAADLLRNGSSSNLEARLPALRGVLNCSSMSSERIDSIAWFSNGDFKIEINMGTGCGTGGHAGHNTSDWAVVYLESMKNSSYFGSLQVLQLSDSNNCPPLMGTYGRVNGVSVDEINIITCFPRVDQVQVDVRFSLPTYHIISTTVDDTTATTFASITNSGQMGIANALPGPHNTAAYLYDNVFAALVNGGSKVRPTAMTDLMGVDNFPRMSTALSQLYGVTLAQRLNLNTRINVQPFSNSNPDSIDTSSTVQGTLTSTDHVRLQQSPTSTRILEGLLTAMVICLAISFFLMTTDKVLPLNPCSIAAGASLLAGARMLRPESGVLPPSSEWYDDKALKASVLVGARTFSLKWWPLRNNQGGEQMRYGIDVICEHGEDHDRQSQVTASHINDLSDDGADATRPSEARSTP